MRSWQAEVDETELEISRLEGWRVEVESCASAANGITVAEIGERIAVQRQRLRLLLDREALN